MKRSEFVKFYWKNYLRLEKFFIDTEKYVSIEKDNNDTYSFEYLSLFVLICNEIDSVLNELCDEIEKKNEQRNIIKKVEIVSKEIPNFKNFRVSTNFDFAGFHFVPFQYFAPGASAEWWQSYNDIKHRRSKLDPITKKPYYYQANLKNVFNSLAALYISINLLYDRCEPDGDTGLSSRVFDKFIH